MSVESTTQVMNDYLDALLKQEDFGRFFADDVLWTTTETGDEVKGRDAVRDFIVAIHTQIFEARPEFTGLTVGDGKATLEANFVGTHTGEFAGSPPPEPACGCRTPSATTSPTARSRRCARTCRSASWSPRSAPQRLTAELSPRRAATPPSAPERVSRRRRAAGERSRYA